LGESKNCGKTRELFKRGGKLKKIRKGLEIHMGNKEFKEKHGENIKPSHFLKTLKKL
jgi:hypothetical protein